MTEDNISKLIYSGQPNVFVFDWSGVLSDDRIPVYEANMGLFDQFGLKRISFGEWINASKSNVVALMNSFGVDADPKFLQLSYEILFNQQIMQGNKPRVYAQAKSVISTLKANGHKVAVLSSHPHDYVMRESREHGLSDYLDENLVRGSVVNKTRGLIDICEEVGESPQNAVYFGDMSYDIAAAKEAGVHSVGLTTGYHTREQLKKENPEFIFDSIRDVMYIRGNPSGGLEVIYPIDMPGLLGGLSAREMVIEVLNQSR